MKTALITGITGQDGAYLSKFFEKNYKVIGITRNLQSGNSNGLSFLVENDVQLLKQTF
jgi:GDPmannose 4,6-dehydratase